MGGDQAFMEKTQFYIDCGDDHLTMVIPHFSWRRELLGCAVFQ